MLQQKQGGVTYGSLTVCTSAAVAKLHISKEMFWGLQPGFTLRTNRNGSQQLTVMILAHMKTLSNPSFCWFLIPNHFQPRRGRNIDSLNFDDKSEVMASMASIPGSLGTLGRPSWDELQLVQQRCSANRWGRSRCSNRG